MHLLTITAWAARQGVSTETARRRIKRGEVRVVRVGRGTVRVPVPISKTA
jgi:predicted site-specific integrase-resolvase